MVVVIHTLLRGVNFHVTGLWVYQALVSERYNGYGPYESNDSFTHSIDNFITGHTFTESNTRKFANSIMKINDFTK